MSLVPSSHDSSSNKDIPKLNHHNNLSERSVVTFSLVSNMVGRSCGFQMGTGELESIKSNNRTVLTVIYN